jgi:ubiquitin-protein ligase
LVVLWVIVERFERWYRPVFGTAFGPSASLVERKHSVFQYSLQFPKKIPIFVVPEQIEMWGWLTSSQAPSDSWDPLANNVGTPIVTRDSSNILLPRPDVSLLPATALYAASETITSPDREPISAAVSPRHTPFSLPASSNRTPFSPPFQTPARDMGENVSMSESEFEAFSLLVDFKFLAKRLPDGMHLLPSFSDTHVWNGWLFVRNGPFVGGVFEFSVRFENYPLSQPNLVVRTRCFHPRVHPLSGVVAPLLSTWKPQLNRVWHVLQAFHDMMTSPKPCAEAALNTDAEAMILTSPETFGQFAKQNAKESALKASATI